MGNVSSHQQAPDADGAADTAANRTNDLLPNSDGLGSSCQIADHEDGSVAGTEQDVSAPRFADRADSPVLGPSIPTGDSAFTPPMHGGDLALAANDRSSSLCFYECKGLNPPSCSAMADANGNPQADASGTSESADMGTNGDHGSPDPCSETQKPSLAERSYKGVLRLTMPTRPCLFTRTMAGNTAPLTEDERNYYMGDALWTAVSEEYEEFLKNPGSYWPEWDPHAILGATERDRTALFQLYGSPGLRKFNFKSPEGLQRVSDRAAIMADQLSDLDKQGLIYPGSKDWHSFVGQLPALIDELMGELKERVGEEVADSGTSIMNIYCSPGLAPFQEAATLGAWQALDGLGGMQHGRLTYALDWA